MKLRIVYDSEKRFAHSRIEDAETGQVIQGVRTILFEHHAGSFPTITLEIIKPIEVEIVGEGVLEDVTEVGDTFIRKRLVPPTRPA